MGSYTIKAGDTLGKIAKKLGVPLAVLIEVNGIQDPNKIRVGQVLQVPPTTTDGMDHADTVPPPVAPAAAPFAVNRTRFRLPAGQFIAEAAPKDLVMLHFTAGSSAGGAFNDWVNTPVRVATPYIVETDGTIYELFDPQFWAFHLGLKGAKSQDGKHDRRAVPIEIVNVGPLQPDQANPAQLNWWPPIKNNVATFGTKFCMLSDTGRYVQKSFRGFNHYAAFPEAQVAAVVALVDHLCDRFGIPKRIPPAAKRDAFDFDFFKNYTGVASHQNFRADKFDMGPAWDWSRLF